jgi:hypothetical protein
MRALSKNLNLLIFDSFKELDKVIDKVIKMNKKDEKIVLSKQAINALTSLLTYD